MFRDFCWIFENNCLGGGVLARFFCPRGGGFAFPLCLGGGEFALSTNSLKFCPEGGGAEAWGWFTRMRFQNVLFLYRCVFIFEYIGFLMFFIVFMLTKGENERILLGFQMKIYPCIPSLSSTNMLQFLIRINRLWQMHRAMKI